MDGRDKWIEAGLARLAEGGVAQLRVEVLAKSLGVTKGGFYWHFADRRALLEAMLASWRDGRIAAIESQARIEETGAARARLKDLLRLYSERVNAQGMAIELAIRQWARADEAAAAVVAEVDAARLGAVARLYRALGLAPKAAEAQAFLFYAFVFGQSLFGVADRRPRLVAACAETLTAVGPR